MRVVIVGGSFAGVQAALAIKQADPNAEVIVIEKQAELGFVPASLTLILQNRAASVDDLRWVTQQKLENKGIQVYTKVACTGLLADDQIGLSTGDKLTFDRLIIATGSQQSFQQAPKKTTKIKTCKTPQDVTEILTQLKTATTVAIIGGGPVGIELAAAIADVSPHVHLFESEPHVMNHYFDLEMIQPLEDAIKNSAVTLHKETFIDAMEETKEEQVRLYFNETNLDVDLVLLANSTRPNNQMWQPLACHEDGTLQVNDYLQTSNPNIYAIGDAIKVKFRLTGESLYLSLVNNAIRTAKIASQNITGKMQKDPGTVRVSGNHWFGYFVGSVGLLEKEAILYQNEIESQHFYVQKSTITTEKIHLKVIWDRDTKILLGAQLVAQVADFALLDQLATAIRQQQTLEEFQLSERFYQPAFRYPLAIFTQIEE